MHLIQVPYNPAAYAFVAEAAAARGASHSGKNVATFALNVPLPAGAAPPAGIQINATGTVTGWSEPNDGHSEARIWAFLNSRGVIGANIAWVYTENLPCGYGMGLANCMGLLNGLLGHATPVFFTRPYVAPDDLEVEATALLGSHLGAFSRLDANRVSAGWRHDEPPIYAPVWTTAANINAGAHTYPDATLLSP